MKTNRMRFLILLAVLGFSLPSAVLGAGTRVLSGHVPSITASLTPLGRLPETKELHLAIGLPLRNTSALSNLLQQIYDPASPNYHHYLTPEQFTEQFGPATQDYDTVINFARTNGFTVVKQWSNRTIVDVSAKVTDIERAFHVQMRTYQHPKEARHFFAPNTEPTLDSSLPILAVSGLNNYVVARPLYETNSLGNSYATGSSPSGSYWGYDFRKAYAPGVTLTGTGQSVALFECDGYHPTDITSYLSATTLPNVPLTNVLIDGFSGQPSGNGGEVEVALDIDMAISMAPGLKGVIVYEGPNDTPAYDLDILNRIAMDDLAKQISSSWVIGDSTQYAQIYQQFALQGQSFFQASGDEGAYYSGIFQYEDSPLVTLVGGTTLTSTGTNGIWASETVWNAGGGASGGGVSTVYSIPSWQTNINMSANHGSTTMRNVPDVALTAYNIYIWGDGSPISNIGGTSCAAPLWAGFMALVNQQLATTGQSPIGFINPAIYALAQTPAYTNAFHDITTGNNTSSSSPTQYYATTGYDLCTGWGTPAGQSLINALASPFAMTLPASATEGAGTLIGAGEVQFPVAASSNMVVLLTSSDPAQLSVPASVTVPAGQTNAAFDLTILDDGILDGTQIATVTASAPGYGNVSTSMEIFDAETATLQLSLPASVTKGQGPIQGTVQVSAPVGANVAISLTSTATNLIQVPASVIVSNGQTSANFTATILTDGQINGGQTVTVTAHVQDWTDGTASVVVNDNLNLTLALPATAWANSGVLTNAGSVSMAGTSTVSQVISLISGNPSLLMVPPSVTLPAGSNLATFNLTLFDSPTFISNQTVTVTASASGFSNGVSSMVLLADGSPPVPAFPSPLNGSTNVAASTNLMWSNNANGNTTLILNGGFEAGSLTNWTVVASTYGRFVINNGTYVPPGPDGAAPPFAGSYDAVGEENGPGIFYTYQTIAIPANATSATLSWAHRVHNYYTSFNSSQEFQVRICDTNNNVLATAFTTNPGDPLLGNWVQTNYNLSAFAGKTVRVMFWVDPGDYYLDVHVDSVSALVTYPTTNSPGIITNDVYFGTNPTPGPAQYQGTTTNTSWSLPMLSPLTTYYWQIVARKAGTTPGPVWQFTTVGIDHFGWSTIASTQFVNQPFNVTITAQDAFNNTVTNFTGSVSLQFGNTSTLIEGFESGTWPKAPWVSAGTTVGTISNAYAHDGNYGLSDPDWMYRTDVSIGNSASTLSWWTRPNTVSGRSYLGFGASAGGCWSVVTAPNSSQFMLQQNPGFTNYNSIVAVSQSWQTGKWYRVAVQFSSPSNITCNLFDSDGVTLLNSLIYNASNSLTGGVAMRSFGTFYLDTITFGLGSGANPPFSPTSSGSFVDGAWNGNITVQQAASNVVLVANDGNGHLGYSNPFSIINLVLPSIVVQPLSQTVLGGTNVTFTVTATGTPPLSYFWQQDGVPLAGANNPSLVLLDVVRTNSGNYTVTVTNIGGSVVSSNATLVVQVPQILGIPALSNNTVTLTSSDFDGSMISPADLAHLHAQASTNLIDWVDLAGALTLTNGVLQLQDTGLANMPMRFYRILEY